MVFYQVWKPVQDPDDVQAFLSTQMGDPFQSVLVAHSDGCVIVQTAEDIPSQVTLERIVAILQIYPSVDGVPLSSGEPAAEEWSIDVFGTDNTSLGRVLVGPGLHVGDSVIQVQKDLDLTTLNVTGAVTLTGGDGANVSLSAPTNGATYALTLPEALPEDKRCLTVDSSGVLSFETSSKSAVTAVHNAGRPVTDCKMWCDTLKPADGEVSVTVHPTDDGSPTGEAVFASGIFHVAGTVIQEHPVGDAASTVTLRSVSEDRKTVTLNLCGEGHVDGVQIMIFGT